MDYQRIYDQIIDRAKERKLQGYKEKHHIIPKCMGGSNEKQNLIELTAREHFICHQLLAFIYPTDKKIAYALWGMCNQLNSINNERKYKVSSRAYQTGREAFIKAIAGRSCTWGDSISKAKKGISQGKRSKEAIEKQKQTIQNNPYKHSTQSRQVISEKLSMYKKTEEHRESISKTNKLKGTKPPSQAKPVTLYGNYYSSIKEACQALNLPRHILSKLLKK